MANILLNPLLWEDPTAHSPPSYWNGSAYEFISDGAGEFQEIDIINPVANGGDIVSFTMQVKTAATGPTINAYLGVNGTHVFSQSVNSIGIYTFTSAPLSTGDDVIFSLGTPGKIYNADILLTPTSPPDYLVKRLQFEVVA